MNIKQNRGGIMIISQKYISPKDYLIFFIANYFYNTTNNNFLKATISPN